MPVKCISDLTKAQIIAEYAGKTRTQEQLASDYSISARTLNRVLVEAGLLTPVSQLKADAHQVMQVLKKHSIEPSKLDQVLSKGYLAPISYEQLVDSLYDMDRKDVTDLFFDAMMHKAVDSHLAAKAVNYQVEAIADALPF